MSAVRGTILPFYLALCLLLGGTSGSNWANLVLQLGAIPLGFWALATRAPAERTTSGRALIALLSLLFLLVGLQLVPLPPALWTYFAGRGDVAAAFELMGQPLPWLGVSLAPDQTLGSAMWLLPPSVILLAILKLGADRRIMLSWVLIGATLAAILLGTLQVTNGSRWYLYEDTNYGAMTGFFANANHMATLLLVSTPFAAALYIRARRRSSSAQKSSALLMGSAIAPVFLGIGLIINNSLAGLGLMTPAAGASLLMIWRRTRRISRWWWLLFALMGAASTAVVFSAPLGNDLTQTSSPTYQITRYYSWPRTFAAAVDFAPLGTGLGTFVNVYPRYEDPVQVEMTYMNHAHNDYLEVALETGLPGLVLIVIFFSWWIRRTLSIWRDADADGVFEQAATIASAAILAHSLVDFPLRMTAISAVFALCCGLMASRASQRTNSGRGFAADAVNLSAD